LSLEQVTCTLMKMSDKRNKAIIKTIAAKRKDSFSRHCYIIYWHMHDWAKKKWISDGWSDITTDHIKLISLIADRERMTNNELAKMAGVTKQAMSQMVTLMEKRGVLTVQQDPNDSRAKLISLSDYGFEFMRYFSTCTEDLIKQYTAILGSSKMKILTRLSGELAGAIFEPSIKNTFRNSK
jgi:DNA-binding MarR family transcriptional regulator